MNQLSVLASCLLAYAHAEKTHVDKSHGHGAEWLERIKAERQAANDPEHIFVHMISHSHDDVGWLKTVDEYYSGANQSVAVAEVSEIISTVVQELVKDTRKKFTFVEIKFFSMWWDSQDEATQQQVRDLISQERVAFVNAGWSMHDEACTHHDDMMNNMMAGHEWLDKTFGYKATIGWHIDPFGHSNANPRLFADMGFDAFFIARMDYEDRAKRLANQEMQWVWRPMQDSLGDAVQIFTHTMQSTYEWPDGYWYDERDYGDKSPVISDESLTTFNADEKSSSLRDFILDKSGHYLGNHLMIPWGGDFMYGNAHITYQSEDNLIDYFNSVYDDITLVRSTPYQYLDALKAQDITWPVKTDDMFPYADHRNEYWTGYFTSRANSKSQVRFAQANIHASNKLFSERALSMKGQEVSDSDSTDLAALLKAKDAMMDANGINQHHDAVTGTARDHVVADYARRISKALEASNVPYSDIIAQKVQQDTGIQSDQWLMCTATNATYVDCPIQSDFSGHFIVAAQNPASVAQSIIRLKLPNANYQVEVYSESDSKWDTTSDFSQLCYEYQENTIEAETTMTCDVFVKANVEAQSQTYLKFTSSSVQNLDGVRIQSVSPDDTTNTIRTSTQSLEYTGANGSEIELKYTDKNNKSYDLAFSLQYYNPSNGTFEGNATLPSGAYIFKPKMDDQVSHEYSLPASYRVLPAEGFDSGDEKAVAFSFDFERSDETEGDEAYQLLLRLVDDGLDLIEFDVHMLSIPVPDKNGKEVIAKWRLLDPDFSNAQTLYTDSNGLEMQKRILNYRPTWELDTDMTVSSNYYPINSAIAIRDTVVDDQDSSMVQMTVMNDRAQGGSSIDNGTIELMQNRRLLYDDDRGLEEPLDETQADGKGIAVNALYRVQLFDARNSQSVQRRAQLVIDEPVQLFFSTSFVEASHLSDSTQAEQPTKQSGISSIQDYLNAFAGQGELKVHLFPEANSGSILIRLANIADLFDGAPLTTPTFDLLGYAKALFAQANPGKECPEIEMTERTLSNSMDYSAMQKTDWKTTAQKSGSDSGFQEISDEAGKVALKPQSIRLFRVVYQTDVIKPDLMMDWAANDIGFLSN